MTGIINSAQQPAAAISPASPSPNVTDWFHNALGRAPKQEGLDYWNGRLSQGGDPNAVYSDFIKAAQANGETVRMPSANTSSSTPQMSMADSYTPSVSESTATPATAVGYTATQQAPAVSSPITQRVVDPSKETVAGQVAGIINQNSPLMQQAQARALQRANDRGLGNSSIAVGAAEDAVLGAAVPIGTADANVYGNAANLNTTTQNQFTANKDASQNQINAGNTAATNTASQFGAAATNTASGENAQLGTNVSEFNSGAHNAASTLGTQLAAQKILNDNTLSSQERNAQLAALTQLNTAQISSNTQRYMTDQNVATQLAVSKMTTASQQSISQAHDANQTLIANNQQASSAYNNYVVAVANIDNNDKMDEAAKRAAIVTQTQIFNAAIIGLRAASPGLSNVTSPIDTTTPVAPTTPTGPTNPYKDPTLDVSHMLDFGG